MSELATLALLKRRLFTKGGGPAVLHFEARHRYWLTRRSKPVTERLVLLHLNMRGGIVAMELYGPLDSSSEWRVGCANPHTPRGLSVYRTGRTDTHARIRELAYRSSAGAHARMSVHVSHAVHA